MHIPFCRSRFALGLVVVALVACGKEQPPSAPPVAEPEPEPDPVAVSQPDPEPESGGAKAAGESCLAAAECASGVCEGEGCAESQPGTCAEANRMCTRDYVTYCGCDWEPFGASGSCPGQRYVRKGECVLGQP